MPQPALTEAVQAAHYRLVRNAGKFEGFRFRIYCKHTLRARVYVLNVNGLLCLTERGHMCVIAVVTFEVTIRFKEVCSGRAAHLPGYCYM